MMRLSILLHHRAITEARIPLDNLSSRDAFVTSLLSALGVPGPGGVNAPFFLDLSAWLLVRRSGISGLLESGFALAEGNGQSTWPCWHSSRPLAPLRFPLINSEMICLRAALMKAPLRSEPLFGRIWLSERGVCGITHFVW
jgi:hypothetical protein